MSSEPSLKISLAATSISYQWYEYQGMKRRMTTRQGVEIIFKRGLQYGLALQGRRYTAMIPKFGSKTFTISKELGDQLRIASKPIRQPSKTKHA